MGRELPSSPTKGLFTGYRFPTLSYTSSSQITILPYTWSLKKVPLSGGASPYRPLSGKYPPGLEATALTFQGPTVPILPFVIWFTDWNDIFSSLSVPRGYSGFQVTGISDRMGANSKPKNTPRLPTKLKKVSGPKTNPKKSHAEFPSKFVCTYSLTRFASMIPWLLSRIFRLFWIPEKIPTTNQATQ